MHLEELSVYKEDQDTNCGSKYITHQYCMLSMHTTYKGYIVKSYVNYTVIISKPRTNVNFVITKQ